MKSLRQILRYAAAVTLCSAAMLGASCNTEKSVGEVTADVTISLSVDPKITRTFVNDNTHTVNRLLIIPFRKTSENATNDNVNFIPALTFAKQIDVSQFPVNNTVLHLPVNTTYKVLILGYNSSDYNFNDRTNPANRFNIGSLTNPTTLDNFHVYPKSPTAVPEFFSCIADVYNGATLQGDTFKPENGMRLSGTLKRIVSGLSVTINNIPAYVTSISLSAENLTRVTKAIDGAPLLSQITGDGGNRVLDNKIPLLDKSVSFTKYLLPVTTTNKTELYLDVYVGLLSTRYTVKVPDNTVSTTNKFTFPANNAINITGNYLSIDSGLMISVNINLDDDSWDGFN